MHAPSPSCLALYRLYPQLRLAWAGRPPKDGELNAGSFAVVQLYHTRDCGDRNDPITFREFWDTTTLPNELGEPERQRIERGPIFNRYSGTKPDWDRERRIPIFVMTLDKEYKYPDGTPLSSDDVFSGKFILAVDAYLTDVKARLRASRAEHIKSLTNQADDMGKAMSDHLWRDANQTGQTRDTSVAYKHIRAEMPGAEYRRHVRSSFDHLYRLPK